MWLRKLFFLLGIVSLAVTALPWIVAVYGMIAAPDWPFVIRVLLPHLLLPPTTLALLHQSHRRRANEPELSSWLAGYAAVTGVLGVVIIVGGIASSDEWTPRT